MKQLARVYPQASRLTSNNFNPVPMWNTACHMVAMNYQTGGKIWRLFNRLIVYYSLYTTAICRSQLSWIIERKNYYWNALAQFPLLSWNYVSFCRQTDATESGKIHGQRQLRVRTEADVHAGWTLFSRFSQRNNDYLPRDYYIWGTTICRPESERTIPSLLLDHRWSPLVEKRQKQGHLLASCRSRNIGIACR